MFIKVFQESSFLTTFSWVTFEKQLLYCSPFSLLTITHPIHRSLNVEMVIFLV